MEVLTLQHLRRMQNLLTEFQKLLQKSLAERQRTQALTSLISTKFWTLSRTFTAPNLHFFIIRPNLSKEPNLRARVSNNLKFYLRWMLVEGSTKTSKIARKRFSCPAKLYQTLMIEPNATDLKLFRENRLKKRRITMKDK